MFFSVQSLLGDKKPWRDQLSGLPHIRGVFDGNGNGFPEMAIKPHGGESVFYYDAFSQTGRLVDSPSVGGSWPIFGEMVVYQGDLDDDSYAEQFVGRRLEQYARIVFGGSPVPYHNHSIVPANYQRSNERRAKILAVGKLSGRTCMLQLAFKADTYDSGYYQLLELNQEDVRARRDTIRTTLLNEVVNPDKWLFSEVVLKADTVWHFFPGGYSAEKASLKVTLSSSSISITKSEIRVSDHSFWYGQGKETSQWNYPVTINAHRLIAADMGVTPGSIQRVLRLFTCSNIDDAELSRFADAQLPITHDSSRGYVAAAVLIPDYDGDGIEDVVVEHGWTDPQTGKERNAVSIFLTTQIKPVSVDEAVLKLDKLDTTTVLTARWAGNAWVVLQAAGCVRRDLSPVYNLQGQKIAMVRTEVNGDDVLLLDNGAITERPAWCVIGECVVRIN
ncbi:MAG: hypothetical protein EHM43_03905 [Ignavibacteriae bacterium]|nr:MAG: hypothetical protein EHM43_03905 [Ignavibacteriota bacterium]